MRTILGIGLTALAAGCGGGVDSQRTASFEAVTTAPAAPSSQLEARRRGARQEAHDLCASLPVTRIAQLAGVDGGDADVAAGLASNVRPELRAAAREGCLSALRQK